MIVKTYYMGKLINTEIIDNYDYTTNYFNNKSHQLSLYKKLKKKKKPAKRKTNKHHYIEINDIKPYFDIIPISPYHFRINQEIDIFPANKRFIVIATRENGTYDGDTLLNFLSKRITSKTI